MRIRVNLCFCHLSAWNIYHSLSPGSLSPSSMIKAKHPVLTPSCTATTETRVRTSVRAGKDIIKNLPCDSKPVSGAFPVSRWKHSSGNRESVWPGDCGDTVIIYYSRICAVTHTDFDFLHVWFTHASSVFACCILCISIWDTYFPVILFLC